MPAIACAALASIKMLTVDDHADTRRALKMFLEWSGAGSDYRRLGARRPSTRFRGKGRTFFSVILVCRKWTVSSY